MYSSAPWLKVHPLKVVAPVDQTNQIVFCFLFLKQVNGHLKVWCRVLGRVTSGRSWVILGWCHAMDERPARSIHQVGVLPFCSRHTSWIEILSWFFFFFFFTFIGTVRRNGGWWKHQDGVHQKKKKKRREKQCSLYPSLTHAAEIVRQLLINRLIR